MKLLGNLQNPSENLWKTLKPLLRMLIRTILLLIRTFFRTIFLLNRTIFYCLIALFFIPNRTIFSAIRRQNFPYSHFFIIKSANRNLH